MDNQDLSIGSDVTMRGGATDALAVIDQFEIVRKLGGGGFGSVYLARDTVAGIDVAVKGLPPVVRNNTEELERIRANFALVSRLHHPYIAAALHLQRVQLADYRVNGVYEELNVGPGDTLMVMEYAPGVTLSQWRRQFPGGKVPLETAVNLVYQVAMALDYSHAHQILHRDVKPSNIMVETQKDGSFVTRVLDFGLAAEIKSSAGRVSMEVRDTSGTRPYMAPEQWAGRKQGPATDQYALACLFCELVTGEVPFASVFETGDPMVMMTAVCNREVELPADCPRQHALQKALSKDPQDRYSTCAEFIENIAKSEARFDVEHGIVDAPENEKATTVATSVNYSERQQLRVAKKYGRLLLGCLCPLIVVVVGVAGILLRNGGEEYKQSAPTEIEKSHESEQSKSLIVQSMDVNRGVVEEKEEVSICIPVVDVKPGDNINLWYDKVEQARTRAVVESGREFGTSEFQTGDSFREQGKKLLGVIRTNPNAISERKKCIQLFADAEAAFKKSAEIAQNKKKVERDKREAERMQHDLVEPYKRRCASKKQSADLAYQVAMREKGRELAPAEFSKGLYFRDQADALWGKVGGIAPIEEYQRCERLYSNAEGMFNKCVECVANRKGNASKNATEYKPGTGENGLTPDRNLEEGRCELFTLPGGVKMEMIYIAPTKKDFWMGRDGADDYREGPAHPVRLTKGYWIGKYPVTQSQWSTLVAKNSSSYFSQRKPKASFSKNGLNSENVIGLNTDDFPMDGISHKDCEELVSVLNKNEKTGKRWALPTEAQWEFAARGGNKSLGHVYSGGDDLNLVGWYNKNSDDRIHSVKEKDVGNELGIVGMSGNVSEWCRDASDSKFYEKCKKEGVVVDPVKQPGKRTCTYVVRGGSYISSGGCQNLSTVRDDHIDDPSDEVGLRLCCLIEDEKE